MANNPHFRNMTFNQTFESSLGEAHREKFTIERSLAQGIKENDVSKIIDKNQDGGTDDTKQIFDELKEAEEMVIDTRKRYDEVKTITSKTQNNIQKMRKQKQLLKTDQEKYEEIVEKQRKNLQAVKQKLAEVTHGMQGIIFTKDIYDHMKDFLKKDILVLKKRFFDRDVTLKRESTKLKSLRTEHTSKNTLSNKCKNLLVSMEKTVHHKQLERTSKIHSFNQILSRKQMNIRNKEIRDREIEEVMISAMTDKLYQEKEWIKIFQTNLFLKRILKGKIEKIMFDNKDIQLSFHKMKQATSIKDTNDFIQRFLSREQTYGSLLETISEKEQKLQQLKQQAESLQKSYENNVQKSESLMEENKRNQVKYEFSQFQGKIEELNQQILKINREKQLIYNWGIRYMASSNGDRTREKTAQKYSKNDTKKVFLDVIKNMKSFLDQLLKEENAAKKIDEAHMKNTVKNLKFTEEYNGRNTRVKTMSAYENEGVHNFDDQDMMYDDLSENDFLQHNRRAVKKNQMINRRFRIKTKPF